MVADANSNSESLLTLDAEVAQLRPVSGRDSRDWRQPPPRTLLLDDGLPNRMGQNDAYGNAVVPAVAEWIGSHLMRTHNDEATT